MPVASEVWICYYCTKFKLYAGGLPCIITSWTPLSKPQIWAPLAKPEKPCIYILSTAVIQQINLLENLCGFKLFVRSNHVVKLTPAGRSLYEDAKTMIHFSDDALQKARLLAESSESTLRIGTSLLYKCRMLSDLWPKVSEIQPDLKIEIRPMKEYESRQTVFSRLGLDFDLFEGIYASAWKGSCRFLELARTPVCCGVSRNHRLAKASGLPCRI